MNIEQLIKPGVPPPRTGPPLVVSEKLNTSKQKRIIELKKFIVE